MLLKEKNEMAANLENGKYIFIFVVKMGKMIGCLYPDEQYAIL